MGIPGMGKTTFIANSLKPFFEGIPDTHFDSVSNDEIRRILIDKYLAKNKGKNAQDAFDATVKECARTFNETLT